MILEGEIKDAEMSSFSSDFHTLITHSFVFSLWIIDEFEKVVLWESADENLWCCHSIEISYADKGPFIAGVKVAYRVPGWAGCELWLLK